MNGYFTFAKFIIAVYSLVNAKISGNLFLFQIVVFP